MTPRVLIAIAAMFALMSPPASAQYVQSVSWAERQPSATEHHASYPPQALREAVEGSVTLLCTISDERKLDCAVESETPLGYGFGEAAMSISRIYVVRRVEEDPRVAIGSRVRVPIRYVLMD